MREGAATTGNITMSSTGFLQLARGTTAQRPSSPTPGMMRFNTDLGYAEIFQLGSWQAQIDATATTGAIQVPTGTTAQRPAAPSSGMVRFNSNTAVIETYASGGWNNMPQMGSTVLSAQNLTLLDGNPTGYMAYWKDPLTYNKTLSVMMLAYHFSVATAYNLTWLQIDPSITGSTVGYVAPTNITLTFMTAFTDRASTKTISLYIDDVEYTNRVVFTGSGDITDEAHSAPLNLDVAAGQKIRLRCRALNSSDQGSLVCAVYFMTRKV
jgi:hypothetical protein